MARTAAVVAASGALLCCVPATAAARAQRPPVVMIIFDEFPADSLVAPGGRLDSRRFPGFAALARHSTWYRNATSVADETVRSVPAILSAGDPRRPGLSWRQHPHSIFTLLGRRGYRIRTIDDTSQLCPPRYCPRPHRLSFQHALEVRRRTMQLTATIRSLRPSRRPTFTFLHSLLPHVPWYLLPSGQRLDPGPPLGIAGLAASPFGFGDPFLTQQDRQRHFLQLGYVDRMVGRLVRRLEREHIFDRALVVVTADHGIAFRLGVLDRRELNPASVQDILPVPLFIKRPHQRRGRTSRVYVRGADVVPTMADVLGFSLGWRASGASAYSKVVRHRRTVRGYALRRHRTIRISAARLEARRRSSVARRDAIVGHGSWRRVYAIGPNRQLLGVRPADLPAAPGPGVKARFQLPAGLSKVDPRAWRLPTWAAGSLAGGDSSGTARRDLALAVNGRIRAVGRSAHLSLEEDFSLIFDARYLRRGHNTLALYEVRHLGANIGLARLGGR